MYIFVLILLINICFLIMKAFWSSILHIYYLYVYIESISKDNAISFVLFFCHQCNSSDTIVQAMIQLISKKFDLSQDNTLYTSLASICCHLKGMDLNSNYNVGSGLYNPCGLSNNMVLKHKEVVCYINILDDIFTTYETKFKSLNNFNMKKMLILYDEINTKIQKCISGIDSIESNNMIQLASLIGLLPIEYYVYVPISNTKDTDLYLRNNTDFFSRYHIIKGNSMNEKLINWTEKEVCLLQKLYTSEYTPNMNNNAVSMIGSCRKEKYLVYLLPSYDNVSKRFTKHNIQLFFRVNGYRKNKWIVEVFDGQQIHTLPSYISSLYDNITDRDEHLNLDTQQSEKLLTLKTLKKVFNL